MCGDYCGRIDRDLCLNESSWNFPKAMESREESSTSKFEFVSKWLVRPSLLRSAFPSFELCADSYNSMPFVTLFRSYQTHVTLRHAQVIWLRNRYFVPILFYACFEEFRSVIKRFFYWHTVHSNGAIFHTWPNIMVGKYMEGIRLLALILPSLLG